MRNPEALLISSVLLNQDWKIAVAKGVNDTMFHIHPEEWQWIETYKRRHRKLPTKRAFREQFPEFTLVKDVDDSAHFAEEVKRNHAKQQLIALLDSTTNDIMNGGIESAISNTSSEIVKIAGSIGSYRDTNIFSDWQDVYKEVEERAKLFEQRGSSGIPTGIPTIDELTGGLQPSTYNVFAARLGCYKALTDPTGVMTPKGWIPIGKLSVGDVVTGSDGKGTKVIAVQPQGVRDVYEVEFSDGTVIEAADDHLWNVRCGSKPWKVQTTLQIMEWTNGGRQRLSIPTLSGPVVFDNELNEGVHLYDAYKLGILLGDGCFRGRSLTFTTTDTEIANAFQSASKWSDEYTYGLRANTKRAIEDLGLWNLKSNDKFIPEQYFTSRVSDRLALIQGLMDSDGSVSENGSPVFTTTSTKLRDGLKKLVESLGGVVTICKYDVPEGGNYEYYMMHIAMPDGMVPFRLTRKIEKFVPRSKYLPSRQIVRVTKTDRSEKMTCISVEATDSLFVTEGCVVTHNSWTMQFVAANAVLNGYNVVFDALEQTRAEVTMRIHSLISGIIGSSVFNSTHLMQGRINLRAYKDFCMQMKEDIKGRLHVCDTSGGPIGVNTFAAQIEKHNPDLGIIDYFGLMDGCYDYQAMNQTSVRLKQTVGNYQTTLLIAQQLNRSSGITDGPAPAEALAGTDNIGRDADTLTTIARYKKKARHILICSLEKNRNGDGGIFYMHTNPGIGSFREITQSEADDIFLKEQDEADARAAARRI